MRTGKNGGKGTKWYRWRHYHHGHGDDDDAMMEDKLAMWYTARVKKKK